MSENINPDETQSVEHEDSDSTLVETSEADDVDNNISLEENLETTELSEEPVLDDAETFPRSYVEKLRKEAAGHRDRAKRADDFAARLHTALVDATGRLADARDLPFDESHLDSPEALQEAIQSLLAERPHLASRKPSGNIGQGVAPVRNDVSLAGILRAGAM